MLLRAPQIKESRACFFFTWREGLDSGKDKDTVVFMVAVEAEAASEMEAARIPVFFMSFSYFAIIKFATLRYWQVTDGLYMQREKLNYVNLTILSRIFKIYSPFYPLLRVSRAMLYVKWVWNKCKRKGLFGQRITIKRSWLWTLELEPHKEVHDCRLVDLLMEMCASLVAKPPTCLDIPAFVSWCFLKM